MNKHTKMTLIHVILKKMLKHLVIRNGGSLDTSFYEKVKHLII
jgi:hypothetical protein